MHGSKETQTLAESLQSCTTIVTAEHLPKVLADLSVIPAMRCRSIASDVLGAVLLNEAIEAVDARHHLVHGDLVEVLSRHVDVVGEAKGKAIVGEDAWSRRGEDADTEELAH